LFSHNASALRRVGVLSAGLALLVSACTSTSGKTPAATSPVPPTSGPTSGGSTTPAVTPPSTTAAAAPVKISATPLGKHVISPTTPIKVTAAHGTLRKVKLINPDGKAVTGAYSADKTSWQTTEVLGYSKTYKLSAKATNSDGESVDSLKHKYTTLTPNNMTMPYFDNLYGGFIKDGGTYGVAMVPVVSFDESISNKAAAEKTLHVTTSPHVDGSWYWADDHSVHWRPRHFYQPGTKVTIDAKVYGVDMGNGLYGQADQKISYTIGRKQVTIAHDRAPNAVNKIRVYRNNHLVRTMNTSMGEHTGETVNGQYINFYTLDGTYTVLGFENPAHMCSDTYGLPANAAGGYPCEDIPWSTKISTDGIYLHELDTTIWAQNSGQDVSHGCLNMDQANAEWFYTHSLVGDPVTIHGAKGAPELQLWQGGDWTMSWKQWQKGSALS
jgi:lipoprotein-anchoring transpeptidase ErfK/SrfK